MCIDLETLEVGDCVSVSPDDPTKPLYLARSVRARLREGPGWHRDNLWVSCPWGGVGSPSAAVAINPRGLGMVPGLLC